MERFLRLRGTKLISFPVTKWPKSKNPVGFFATDRIDFRPLAAHVVAQIEPQDYHKELGEVEGSLNMVVSPPEVARGRKWVRVGFRVFFGTGLYSSVKVTKTFTDEIFVGKGYS